MSGTSRGWSWTRDVAGLRSTDDGFRLTVPPDAPEGTAPRAEYDPKWRTLEDRITAKAAELAATGHSVSMRTLQRLRSLWRDQGLWGLVDRRATRVASPTGQVDERVVAVLMEVLAEQGTMSTGTRSRAHQEMQRRVVERHGPDVGPRTPTPCVA